MEIKNKNQYFSFFEKGFFGNKPLTWKSLEDLEKSDWKGQVTIRSKKGIARSKTKYNVPIEKIQETIHEMVKEGMQKNDLTFNQTMPDDKLAIQGELMLTEKGMYFLYSKEKDKMNIALSANSSHAIGIEVKFLLEKYLSPSSISDLYELLELFPDSVIEFSAYEINLGNQPHRNTVIWEVRNY